MQPLKIKAQNITCLLQHLIFCDPQRSARYRYSKVVDLYAIELIDRDLDRIKDLSS